MLEPKAREIAVIGVWGNCSFSAAQTGNRIYNSKEESPAELFGRVGQVHANVAPPSPPPRSARMERFEGAWGCMGVHEASEGWCGDGGHGKSVGNSLEMNEKCLKTNEKTRDFVEMDGKSFENAGKPFGNA